MTLYVRLVSGVEDTFPDWVGCKKCGDPCAGDPDRCPTCRAGEHIQDNVYKGGWGIPRARWNSTATEQAGGTLIVTRLEHQVGYYPAGAWLSWRAT